jgi:ABC-2 type transport system ATP-binding protein
MCNKVGIIDKGVMDFTGTVADALKKVRERIVLYVVVSGDQEPAARLLEGCSDLVERVTIDRGQLVVTLKQGVEDYSDLSPRLIQGGHKLKLFREEEVNLESAFMALTKGLGQRV